MLIWWCDYVRMMMIWWFEDDVMMIIWWGYDDEDMIIWWWYHDDDGMVMILSNTHCTLYGNQISEYFGVVVVD